MHKLVFNWLLIEKFLIKYQKSKTKVNTLTPSTLSLLRSSKKFSFLSVIRFLWCYFGEVDIASTNNPLLIFFFILITCLFDIVMILWGEILSWSFMGVKGSINQGELKARADNPGWSAGKCGWLTWDWF